jgi:hypothetical protein
MSEADLLMGNLNNNEEEINRRRHLVVNNPRLKLTKKKSLQEALLPARNVIHQY